MANRYESKQQQIFHPANQIYLTLEKFSNFTPMIGDKVENWSADDNQCSFTAKGMNFVLKIVDRQPSKVIKIVPGEGGVPINFSFWLQMKEVGENDTRIRLVLDIDLNFMLRSMVGGKIQDMLDKVAEGLAIGFNNPNPDAWKF